MKESKVECVFHVDETGQEFQSVAMLFEYTYGKHQFWFGVANILLPNGRMQLSDPGTIKTEDGRTGKIHFNGFKIVKDYGEVGFIGISPLSQEAGYKSEEEQQKIVRNFIEDCYMLMQGNERIINPLSHLGRFDKWYEYLAAATDGKLQRNGLNLSVNWSTSESTGFGVIVEFVDSEEPSSNVMKQIGAEQQERFQVVKKMDSEKFENILIEINKTRHSR